MFLLLRFLLRQKSNVCHIHNLIYTVLHYFITALLFAVPAFVEAPLVTDDTGTQGKGKYQLDLDIGVKGRINNVAPPATVLAGLTTRF